MQVELKSEKKRNLYQKIQVIGKNKNEYEIKFNTGVPPFKK